MLIKKLLLIFSLINMAPYTHGLFRFELSSYEEGLPFLSERKIRIQQLDRQKNALKAFEEKSIETKKSLNEKLNIIGKELTSFKTKLQEINERFSNAEKEKQEKNSNDIKDHEYVTKKIEILQERQQIVENTLDALKKTRDSMEEHIVIIKKFIDFFEIQQKTTYKTVYSWKELIDAQSDLTELSKKIEEKKREQIEITKNKDNEKASILSIQQQLDQDIKEHEKKINDARTKELPVLDLLRIEHAADIFSASEKLLADKKTLAEQSLERIQKNLVVREDELQLLNEQLVHKKNILHIINDRLLLNPENIEQARQAALEETEIARKAREPLKSKFDLLKQQKAEISARKKELQDILKALKEKGERETVNHYYTQSKLVALQEKDLLTERTMDLITVQQEILDAQIKSKDVTYDAIALRYKLKTGVENLDNLINKYKRFADEVLRNKEKFEGKYKLIKESPITTKHIVEKRSKIQSKKDVLFVNEKLYPNILKNLAAAEKTNADLSKVTQTFLTTCADLIAKEDEIINHYKTILEDLKTRKSSEGLWKRSPKAISIKALNQSFLEAETFFKELFWDTPLYLGFTNILNTAQKIDIEALLLLIFFGIFFAILFFSIKMMLKYVLKKTKHHLTSDHKHLSFLSLNIIISMLEFALDHLGFIFTWVFLYAHILFKFKLIFSTIKILNQPYCIALFYLISIPIFVYLSKSLLTTLKELNKRLSFFFFAEKLQDRFILLITFFCYSTAILMPLRLAFLGYYGSQPAIFPDVIIAAYSLILVIILLLFFSKEDVLRFIPSRFGLFILLKKQVEKHYYPVFIFLMGLLILSNPYVGYSNLAWFLAFAVPLTTSLLYGIFLLHYYVRTYAVFLFMKEEDEEITDKFEHAKTYYGILVIFSFLVLFFFAFFLASRIWGIPYALTDIWKLLSEDLVVPIGPKNTFGVIQFATLLLFIFGAFFVSSIIHRFILSKLFDILRTQPGTQNTVSKIFHYILIALAFIFGLYTVHLEQLITPVGALLGVGLGFALKDIVTDYVAGFLVLLERPVEIGNFVRVSGGSGDIDMLGVVHKIDARTTTLITPTKHTLIIPNKDLISKTIDNWGKGHFATGFDIQIRVDYKSDIDLVRTVLTEVVQSNPTILRVPRTVIRLDDFEPNGLYFLVRSFISSRRVTEQWHIAATIREDIFKAFKAKDIQFSFPQHVIHMEDKRWGGGTQNPMSPVKFSFDK